MFTVTDTRLSYEELDMKKVTVLVTTIAMMSAMALTSVAGTWGKSNDKWYYLNEDGSYATSGWQWIDGDNDGVAECYYFDGNGWLLANTTTPDGYTVNANGAWIKDGVVQQKNSSSQSSYSRVWADGVYTLADALNSDYTKEVTITIQGDKLSVSSAYGTDTYTYWGKGVLDGKTTDAFAYDNSTQEGGRELLLVADDGKIYSTSENDSEAYCAYESIEEHKASIQKFREEYKKSMHQN